MYRIIPRAIDNYINGRGFYSTYNQTPIKSKFIKQPNLTREETERMEARYKIERNHGSHGKKAAWEKND